MNEPTNQTTEAVYCDCERGHNGIGLAGRLCDCQEDVVSGPAHAPTTERRLIVRDGDVCWLYPDGSHRCVTQADVDELNRLRESRAVIREAAELVRTKAAT